MIQPNEIVWLIAFVKAIDERPNSHDVYMTRDMWRQRAVNKANRAREEYEKTEGCHKRP